MALNSKDYAAIDAAVVEHFKENNINTKCPRCGTVLVCVEHGNSYEVKCKKGCISERFSGV